YAAGNATVTATAGGVTTTAGDRLAVDVAPAGTSKLTVTSTAASPQPAGSAFDLTLAARDPYGNTTPAYRGTVDFGSNDAQAVLPASYMFTAADGGTHTFGGAVTLETSGTKTITATDDADST